MLTAVENRVECPDCSFHHKQQVHDRCLAKLAGRSWQITLAGWNRALNQMPGLMLGHCCQRFYGIRRDAEIAKIIRRSKDQPTLIQHRQMNVGIAETFDHAICTVLRRWLLHINGR